MQMKPSILVKIIVGMVVAVAVCGCTPAAKKARMFKRAEADFNAGKYEQAKVEYLSLLRSGMETDTILLRIGSIWLEQGAPLRAFPFLLRAQSLAPENVAVRERLAFAYLSVGQIAEARKEAIIILQKAPANVQGLLYLSDAARSPEDLEGAAQQLQKFPAKDTASFHLASANVAMREGDAAGAENSLKLALAADPKSFSPHLAMANFYISRKDLVHAGEEFKAGAELAPPRSGAGLRYAEFKMQNGQTEEARAIVQKITEQAPDYLPATLFMAQISFKEKKYDETLAAVENVLARDERNLGAYMLRAQTWEAKG